MKCYTILGGGISGLSSAYYLSKLVNPSFAKIILLEGSNRVGGWVESTHTKDGAVFDHGPRSLRGAGRVGFNSLKLFEELGLSSEVLPVCRNHPAAMNRYIYANNQLCILPSSIGGVVRKMPPFSKSLLSYGWKEPFKKKDVLSDDSVYNFFQRRLGEEVAKYVADPLCRGIFAGDARKLGMKACFTSVFNWEQEHGSIVKGALRSKKDKSNMPEGELIDRYKTERWAMWSLRQGLGQLTDTLEQELAKKDHVQIVKGSPCESVEFTGNKVKITSGDKVIEADHVVCAFLANKLGPLLEDQHRLFAANLKSIPSVHAAVVHIEYKGSKLPHMGFGHLVPSTEPSKVLGNIYQSCIFPEHCKDGEETTRLICMLGGAWFDEYFGSPDSCNVNEIEEIAIRSSAEQLNIKEEPIRVMTRIHKDCIPQYLVGHTEIVQSLDNYIRDNNLPLSLVGASYKGVSVNDCIYNAKIEAEKIAEMQK